MSIYYVYIYVHPITNVPFYVGYGKNDRYISHIKEAKYTKTSNHKLNTIRKILEENLVPTIVIVDDNLDKSTACELETFLISEIGRRCNNTGTLTNITSGGDGGDTFSTNPNKDDIRNKISEKSKLYNNIDERKVLQSEIAKRVNSNMSAESREQARINMINTKNSIEWKESHKVTEETKRKQSDVHKERYKDEKLRVKCSLNAKNIWKDPSIIEKMPAKIKVCCLKCRKEVTLLSFYRWHKTC